MGGWVGVGASFHVNHPLHFVFSRRAIFSLVIISTLLLPVAAVAQAYPELQTQAFAGSAGRDIPKRLYKGADGALYLAGATETADKNLEGYVARLDPATNTLLWERYLRGNGNEMIADLVQQDTVLYCAGSTGSALPHPEEGSQTFAADYLVVALHAKTGRVLWQRTLGGSGADRAAGIALLLRGELVVAGTSASRDHDVAPDSTQTGGNGWVAHLLGNGMAVRYRVLGGSGQDVITSVAGCKNGGVLLAGLSYSKEIAGSAAAGGAPWVLRLNDKLETVWQYAYPQTGRYAVNRVVETYDGGALVVGAVERAERGSQFWLLRLNAKGEMVFEKTFGESGYEELTAAAQCADKGIVATGYAYNSSSGSAYFKGRHDLWVLRMDGSGNIVWQQTYGGPQNEKGVDVLEYAPGMFYVLGEKENHFTADSSRQEDYWLLGIGERPCIDLKPGFRIEPEGTTYTRGDVLRFINTSAGGQRWYWDYGDGTHSTERSPVKRYTKAGRYLVTLSVFMNERCRLTYSLPYTIEVREP
jgi:hypothetical protein